ncbi:Hsp70 family protein [Actinomycetospora sp. C-140]
MAYGLGVDLGTTYTAAAVVREGHVEMAPLGDRSTAMPSVILMRAEGGVLTGDAANRRAASEPDRVAREVKRRLGDPTPMLLGGTPYSAGDLLAAQLREVVAQISEREGGPPSAVRLTHPANWGPYKRELFEQVPRLAGLHDVAMITEPEAAAAHYATNERIAEGSTVAVYDLGGGTFDATILRTTGGGFEILGEPEGVEGLGGVDFDEAVYAYVDRTLDGAVSALDPADAAATSAIVRLRQDCVLAKEALSADTDATIPVLLPSQQTEVRLTRGEFEDMIRPSVASTIAALQRALVSADVEPEQLDKVLLVGGSSRIPLVARMVSAEMGRPTAVDAHPKHAIVLGAAMLVEPPARAAGPGAPSPAHTSVFPSSGAPYRTPIPPVSPRTPSGGVRIGTGAAPASPRQSSGPSSGMIPTVASTRGPSTGGTSTGRTSTTYTPKTRTGAAASSAFSPTARTPASTTYTPTTRTTAGGQGPHTGQTVAQPHAAPTQVAPTHTGPTQVAPTHTGPTQVAPAHADPGRQAGRGPTGTAALYSGAAASSAHGAPPPPLDGGDRHGAGEEAPVGRPRRRMPLVLTAVLLVALLAGGGTFAYRALASSTPPAPGPTPTQVVAPEPLPTTTAAPPTQDNSGGTPGGTGRTANGGAGGSGGSGGGGGRWTTTTTTSHHSSGTTDGSTGGSTGTGTTGGCCEATPGSSSDGGAATP